MLLKKITLYHFRNFVKESFDINPFLTIIIGQNALGKTNLLEAVYFVINGTGFRETKEIELLNFNTRSQHASVEGSFAVGDTIFNFKIGLEKKEESIKKTFLVSKSKKKQFQYVRDQTKVVLFTPQQIDIIIGPPQVRRDYFNKLLSFYDFDYKRKVDNYDQALRRRNKLLAQYKTESQLAEQIEFWNNYLVEQADYITKKRQDYVDFLNKNNAIEQKTFSITYVKNEFSKQKLQQVSHIEVRARKTLIGPQKDDFQIFIKEEDETKEKNVHHLAARSEQRLAVLWLKMNEIRFYENFSKKKPILLFDDVFSELDLKNKKLVLDLIKKYQTMATTTEIEVLQLIDIPKTIIKL